MIDARPDVLKMEAVRDRYRPRGLEVPFDLVLKKGEFAALIGQERSGIQDILRLISGQERVVAGRIIVAGDLVATKDFHQASGKRQCRQVTCEASMLPHLSVEDNVRLGFPESGRRVRCDAIQRLLSEVGVARQARLLPRELNQEEYLRVVLARALAASPALLLWNAPLVRHSLEDQQDFVSELRALAERREMGVLLANVQVGLVLPAVERAGVLHDGALLQWDTPYRLYHHPATREVVMNTGSGTLLPAVIRPEGLLMSPLGTLKFLGSVPEDLLERDVELLVRPDDVVADPRGLRRGLVLSRRFMGPVSQYRLEIDDRYVVSLMCSSHLEVEPGKKLAYRISMDHVIVFPEQGEQAVELGAAQLQ